MPPSFLAFYIAIAHCFDSLLSRYYAADYTIETHGSDPVQILSVNKLI